MEPRDPYNPDPPEGGEPPAGPDSGGAPEDAGPPPPPEETTDSPPGDGSNEGGGEAGWGEAPGGGWHEGGGAPPGGGLGPGEPPPHPSTVGGPSWEYRKEIGFFAAVTRTISEVLFRPGETFAGARKAGGIGQPLLFALLTGSVFGIAGQLITMAIMAMGFSVAGSIGGGQLGQAMSGGGSGIQSMLLQQALGTGIGIIFLPVQAVVYPMLLGLICHLGLMIVKGARYDFEATYRVVAYVYGAASALMLIPICGGLIFFVWTIVVAIIGLTQMHRVETWKGVVGGLSPLAVYCCVIGGAIGAGAVFFYLFRTAAMGNP